MQVKSGDTVKIEYTGTFDDGTVFDSTEKHGEALEFEVGKGQVIKGFNDAVIGMKINEEKSIRIQPKEAYGDPNPALVRKVPRDMLPKAELKAGMILLMQLQTGAQLPVKIAEINPDEATLDMNHPLAGKVLNFKIKVISIAS